MNFDQDEASTSLGRFKVTFNEEMEDKLVKFLRLMDNLFFGLTKLETRKLAYDFAERNNIDHPNLTVKPNLLVKSGYRFSARVTNSRYDVLKNAV